MRAMLAEVHVLLAHEQPDIADELHSARGAEDVVNALTAAVMPRRNKTAAAKQSRWGKLADIKQVGWSVEPANTSGGRALALKEQDACRRSVPFDVFFDGRTPRALQTLGIYTEIAISLKAGHYRPIAMSLLARAVFAPPKRSTTVHRRPLLATTTAPSSTKRSPSSLRAALAKLDDPYCTLTPDELAEGLVMKPVTRRRQLLRRGGSRRAVDGAAASLDGSSRALGGPTASLGVSFVRTTTAMFAFVGQGQGSSDATDVVVDAPSDDVAVHAAGKANNEVGVRDVEAASEEEMAADPRPRPHLRSGKGLSITADVVDKV